MCAAMKHPVRPTPPEPWTTIVFFLTGPCFSTCFPTNSSENSQWLWSRSPTFARSCRSDVGSSGMPLWGHVSHCIWTILLVSGLSSEIGENKIFDNKRQPHLRSWQLKFKFSNNAGLIHSFLSDIETCLCFQGDLLIHLLPLGYNSTTHILLSRPQ